MKQWKLIPELAFRGIWQNRMLYIPYLLAGIFSCFTYFVFRLILDSAIIEKLPKSIYAYAMLQIGLMLLVIILLPFLYYANSFLLKRRKRELGLYSLLGLEKKHIGLMMFVESILLYIVVIIGGVVSGLVLAKLVLLLFLRLSGLPLGVTLTFQWKTLVNTMVTFGLLFGCILISSLVEVSKVRPIELMSGSKKGEKEPKFVVLWGIVGIVLLAAGYRISITSKMNSEIFLDFFLAVLLVSAGTYFLFTSGSIMLLRLAKKNKKIYYSPNRFITISGMLYRMKKNAASLSNICIFATMILITMTCTLALGRSMGKIESFDFPYDMVISTRSDGVTTEAVGTEVKALCEKYKKDVVHFDVYRAYNDALTVDEERIVPASSNWETIYMVPLADYNKMHHTNYKLEAGELAVFSSGTDWHKEKIYIGDLSFDVAMELQEFRPFSKNIRNTLSYQKVIIAPDMETIEQIETEIAKLCGVTDMKDYLYSKRSVKYNLSVTGTDEEKQELMMEYLDWMQQQRGYEAHKDGLEGRDEYAVMNGSMIFIGIIFGIIFMMCLVLIMYYKQVSEGYEDQNSFSIMRKVGLSDEETRKTIHQQILLVFGLPLLVAVIHTFAGMFMVQLLMTVTRLFEERIIWKSAVEVMFLFAAVYIGCYLFTAKSYYKIVKQ